MVGAQVAMVYPGRRRFDIGCGWFNRKFDIEKKPLQSIGLVAGALVAVVYWAAVIVSKVIGLCSSNNSNSSATETMVAFSG
jgi:hypothetical protein